MYEARVQLEFHASLPDFKTWNPKKWSNMWWFQKFVWGQLETSYNLQLAPPLPKTTSKSAPENRLKGPWERNPHRLSFATMGGDNLQPLVNSFQPQASRRSPRFPNPWCPKRRVTCGASWNLVLQVLGKHRDLVGGGSNWFDFGEGD